MINFSLRAFLAFFIILNVSSVYAQNKVVVIPLGADAVAQGPTVEYVAVSPAAFTPRIPSTTSYQIGSGGQLRILNTSGPLYASLNLPHGATIESIQATLWDDAPGAIGVDIERINRNNPSFDTIFSIVSTGDMSGSRTFSDNTSSGSAVVDNQNYSYLVKLDGTDWNNVGYDMRYQHLVIKLSIP